MGRFIALPAELSTSRVTLRDGAFINKIWSKQGVFISLASEKTVNTPEGVDPAIPHLMQRWALYFLGTQHNRTLGNPN